MSKKVQLKITRDTYLEACNIEEKVFDPLKGFMGALDYKNVVNNMHLDDGTVWTIPVTLDVPEEKVRDVIKADKVILKNTAGEDVAEVLVEDVFKVDYEKDIKQVFGTDDRKHPGVIKEVSRSPYRIGGAVKVLKFEKSFFPEYKLAPSETRKIFKEKKWKTIVGFQTRNPIHRAHEYLQRVGMEICDGILLHPLIGWKKADDFSPLAVVRSYERMIKEFYHPERAMLCVLTTPMRYAGPREAVFHAIVRKNYGCTHFIVGRDHAGVGNYYGKYDAHKLCSSFNDLGIEILKLHGPYFCRKCGGVVTEKTCPHGDKHSSSISGTFVRKLFSEGRTPSSDFMRREISEVLLDLVKTKSLFCGGKRNEF